MQYSARLNIYSGEFYRVLQPEHLVLGCLSKCHGDVAIQKYLYLEGAPLNLKPETANALTYALALTQTCRHSI